MAIIQFISKYYNFKVFILFLISSLFLIFIDGKGYKKMNLMKEYKFSKIAGYTYLFIGILLLIIKRYIDW